MYYLYVLYPYGLISVCCVKLLQVGYNVSKRFIKNPGESSMRKTEYTIWGLSEAFFFVNYNFWYSWYFPLFFSLSEE